MSKVDLPEDVKQRFPSLRYWSARLQQGVSDDLRDAVSTIETEITALRERLDALDALVQGELGQLERPASSDVPPDATFWLSSPAEQLTQAVVIGELPDGYLKQGAGVPSTVLQVPDSDIEYSAILLDTGTDVDWSLGRVFYKELNGDTSISFSNTVCGKQIMLIVKQNASVAYACAFGAVKWRGGTAPDLTTVGLGSYNIFAFLKSPVTGDIIGTVLMDAR